MASSPNLRVNQLYWLLILFLAFFITTVALPLSMGDLSFAFSAALPLFFCWLLLTVWSVVLGIRMLEQQAVILGLFCLFFPFAIGQTALDAGDEVKFLLMRPYYDREVTHLPKNGARFEEFSWGGLLFVSRGVVYDETDQMGLPAGHQSRAWIARMKDTDLMCGENVFRAPVSSLGGHYYLTGFGC